MNFVIFFILEAIFSISKGETPLTSCQSQNPFKMIDNSCSSFYDTCIKKEDENCKVIINACSQCPPANWTITGLLNLRDQLNSNITKLVNIISKYEAKSDTRLAKLEKKGDTYSLTIVIIILLCILFLILIFEIRFKLITKLFQLCITEDYTNNRWRSRKVKYKQITQSEIKKEFKEQISFLEEKLIKQFDALSEQITKMSINSTPLKQFQIKDKLIELYVKKDDNIVKIKKKICTKRISAKENDDKRMKLKYNGTILDNNDYLLKQIGSNNDVINCDIDDAINVNNIIIVRLQSNIPIPKLIQINKDKTIADLKIIISKITHLNEYKLFYKLEILSDEEIINNYNLNTDDVINLITSENGTLSAVSIFNELETISINYSNINKLSSIRNIIANNKNTNPDFIILFMNNNYLDVDSFIFNIGIDNESIIKYCCLKSCDLLLEKKESNNIMRAKEMVSKKKIFLKKYNYQLSTDGRPHKALINELITFQITKGNPRFVKILDLYKDNNYIYIAMDDLEKESLKLIIETKYPIKEEIIAKWSKQILEALKYLHDKLIIQRNVKPTSVFIDANNDIKLASFGLSKYVQGYEKSYLIEGFSHTKLPTLIYMAPEVMNDENYGRQVDVWSFGVVLIEIVTGKPPYPDLDEATAMIKIAKSREIEYKLPEGTSNKLKNFIAQCLNGDPQKRSKISKLLNDEFLQQ